jgi:hypothetical protein
LVSLGVHALRVGHVVALLHAAGGGPGGAGTRRRTNEQARAGAYCSARASADQRPSHAAYYGAERGTSYTAIDGCLFRGGSDLIARVLAALGVVVAKLVKILVGAR